MAFFVSVQIVSPVPALSFCQYLELSQPSAWRSAISLFLFLSCGTQHSPISSGQSDGETPHTVIAWTGAS